MNRRVFVRTAGPAAALPVLSGRLSAAKARGGNQEAIRIDDNPLLKFPNKGTAAWSPTPIPVSLPLLTVARPERATGLSSASLRSTPRIAEA